MSKLKQNIFGAGWMTTLFSLLLIGCAGRNHLLEKTPKRWQELDYGFPEQQFSFQGHNIVYIDVGPRDDPAPIVLIHGLGMNLKNWQHTIPFLSKQRRVIAIDLLGCGKSDKPRDYPYTPSSQVPMLLMLFAHLDLQKVTLVGNSMGGHISLWLASKYPEKIDRLVLVDSTGFLRVPWVARSFLSEKRVRKLRRRSPKFYSFLLFVTMPDDFEERMQEAYSLRTHDPAWADFAYAFQQSLHGIHYEQWKEKFPEIEVPTLIVWGIQDDLVSQSHAHRFQQSIPKSELELLSECGHLPMWECPEQFNGVLAKFLNLTSELPSESKKNNSGFDIIRKNPENSM